MLSCVATDAWRNWVAFNDDNSELENIDEDLYSDRQFVAGPAVLGPYRLSGIIRPAQIRREGRVGSAVRLHSGIHEHLLRDPVIDGKLVRADSNSYHGGASSDEVAALVSLALGVRLRVAGVVQMSLLHRDGNPRDPVVMEVLPLAQPGPPGKEYIPAALTRDTNLGSLKLLQNYPSLSERAQIALAKAARAYATGLWWANEDPNQAWLQFVTAVEIGASCRGSIDWDPEDLVRELWPDLWRVVEPATKDMRSGICRLLAPQVRATRKFIDFLVELAPEPPPVRPPFGQLDWKQLKDHARVIYGHRSKALHDGKAFPLPMLERPSIDEDGAVQEVPLGLNSSGLGGIWDAAEAPMLLTTFEHLVRGSLLRWWSQLT